MVVRPVHWSVRAVQLNALLPSALSCLQLHDPRRLLQHTVKSIAAYAGEKTPSQTALCGGGAIMTAREKIPRQLVTDLAPIIGAYIS